MIYIYSPVLFKMLTFGNKRFHAMAIFPLLISKLPKDQADLVLINHERIHFKQQIETLWIGFFIIYFTQFIFYRFKKGNSYEAYMAIPFEKEAYLYEEDFSYLTRRKLFNWIKK